MIRLNATLCPGEPSNPPADRIIRGDPQATVQAQHESADGKFHVGIWTCSPGRWRIRYDEQEYCRILSGTGAVIDSAGKVHTLAAGDEIVIPPGFVGEWDVTETMTKTYVISLP